MLDQNTDRMWYVIGAVIVGAAIIFLVNSSFPQLFASVGTVFTDKTDEVSNEVSAIGKGTNLLTHEGIYFNNTASIDRVYDASSNTWTFKTVPWGAIGDPMSIITMAKERVLKVPYGESITFSYEVRTDRKVRMRHDSNMHPIDVDGTHMPDWEDNDNDDLPKRRINGVEIGEEAVVQGGRTKAQSVWVNANEWTKVSFGYTNTSAQNTGKYTMEDTSNFGIFNPDILTPFTMQVRNIQAEYGTSVTAYAPTK